MKIKKKLKWVAAGAVVVIAAGLLYQMNNKGIDAEVLALEKGEMKQYIEDTARAVSVNEQTVYLEGTGKILAVNADVGDTVKQGDLLLKLDKAELELKLRDAEAKIQAAKAQLKGTELYNYATEIEQAEAEVDQAENVYESAKRNFENAKSLYEAEALSKKEFEDAQDAYDSALAVLNFKKLQLKDVQQGAPGYVREGYSAQLEQAVIYRDTILRSIEKQELRAPADGVILERLVDENSPALPSTPAFKIGNVGSLELVADVLADDAGKVKIGDDVEISGKAIGDTVLKGKVKKIAPEAKIVTSSLGINQKRVPVTIEIGDQTGAIKPGYDLDVKIITAVKTDVVRVPDSSVFDLNGLSSVFIVKDGRAVLQTVKKGIESEDYIEITEGLNEGDIILKKPDNNIKEGAKINLPGAA